MSDIEQKKHGIAQGKAVGPDNEVSDEAIAKAMAGQLSEEQLNLIKDLDKEEGERLMAVAGYMTIHTRQLDMIMQDPGQVAARRAEMLAHCRALFRGESLNPAAGSSSQEAR